MNALRYILLVCLYASSVVSASAQNTETSAAMQADAEYWRVVKSAEAAADSCDSLATLLGEMRARYAASEDNREGIAARIVVLESEMRGAQKRCDEAMAEVVAFERRWILANRGRQPESDDKGDASQSELARRESADFVRNGLFAATLPASDYKTLCEMQARETVVVDKIADYRKIYNKMVALRAEYDAAEKEADAVPLLAQIEQLRKKCATVEDDLIGLWQSVSDNKTYLYNLLLEQEMRGELLTETERIYSASQTAADGCVGAYESDVLSSYYHQKRGMLMLETRMATELGMPLAVDSLKRVTSSLRAEEYCLPQVSLEKRSFIEYEPLKVILPTIYSSRNPIPQTKVYEQGIIYRVRIGIFTNRPNLSALRGITPLSYTTKYHNGKNAYFVGGFRTEAEAREGVVYLKKIGFRDPVVVMWVDGEYISDLSKAREAEVTYSIEISGVASLSDAVKSVLSRNADCRISRVGGDFVVGAFVGRSVAESVADEIRRVAPSAEVKVRELTSN